MSGELRGTSRQPRHLAGVALFTGCLHYTPLRSASVDRTREKGYAHPRPLAVWQTAGGKSFQPFGSVTEPWGTSPQPCGSVAQARAGLTLPCGSVTKAKAGLTHPCGSVTQARAALTQAFGSVI